MGRWVNVREYRITQPGPWFRVEGSGDWLRFRSVRGNQRAADEPWTQIARFLTRIEASEYVQEVQARQRALLVLE